MNEQLLEGLRAAFEAHGIAAAANDGALLIQDGLVLEPRVFQRGSVRGTVQVQVDFSIESPRMNGIPFLDSFAGVGDTAESAEKSAVLKFLQGSFHVIAAALTRHSCDDGQVEWDDWTGPAHAWRVCAGPVLLLNTREGARIDGFSEFFPQLTELFCAGMPEGPHWMRVFLGTLDGKHTGSEVLVDGQVWAAGQQLLDAHPWVYPPGYASFRHLLIALPPHT
jgi:hypothetical protein